MAIFASQLADKLVGTEANELQFFADVVKLVDTLDLGSSAVRRGGSTPSIRTSIWMV